MGIMLFINLLLAVFCITIEQYQATRMYCHGDATGYYSVNLNFRQPMNSNINLCFYIKEEKWSTQSRTCSWRIRIPSLVRPSNLAIEHFVVDALRDTAEFNATETKARRLIEILEVKLEGIHEEDEKWIPWNALDHFQVFPLRSGQDYLDIKLVLDNQERINISNHFYLRISYSNNRMCSRGLMKLNDWCLTVRTTNKMSQAVGFNSLSAIEDFYNNYERLATAGTMGDVRHNTGEPLRLGMTHCINHSDTQLLHCVTFSNGTCGCNRWKIPADRLLPGTGNCISTLRKYQSGIVFFRPVLCNIAMPSLLRFPSVPSVDQDISSTEASGCSPCQVEMVNCSCINITRETSGYDTLNKSIYVISIIAIVVFTITSLTLLIFLIRNCLIPF